MHYLWVGAPSWSPQPRPPWLELNKEASKRRNAPRGRLVLANTSFLLGTHAPHTPPSTHRVLQLHAPPQPTHPMTPVPPHAPRSLICPRVCAWRDVIPTDGGSCSFDYRVIAWRHRRTHRVRLGAFPLRTVRSSGRVRGSVVRAAGLGLGGGVNARNRQVRLMSGVG